jgi:hypothetical protein
MNLKPYVFVFVFATPLVTGCSSDDPVPRLLDSAPETPDEASSAEQERLRKMQLVRVIDTSQDPEEVIEIAPGPFSLGLADCGSVFQDAICDNNPNSCERLTCLTQLELCQGQLLLAIATGTGSSVTMPVAVFRPDTSIEIVDARVPPQSAATNAALAIQASGKLEQAMAHAMRTLNGECSALESEIPEFTGDATVQAFAAASFVDAFEDGKRAYRVAYKNTLAVSDAELSSSNELKVARIRAIANETLSRSAAAHLMVGGKPGFFGSTREAFCTDARLTGPEQAALSVLREAALHPTDVITDEIPIDALVNGATTGPQAHGGTVRERLADLWGAGALPESRPLWEAYGLKEGDFDAARRAMIDDIRTFGRSFEAKLEPRALPGGRTPVFDRYASTAGKPPERPDEYWALLAQMDAPDAQTQEGFWREGSENRDIYLDSSGLPITGAASLAEFVDRTYAWANLITTNATLPSAESEVVAPLTHLLGGEDTRGRLLHCLTGVDGQPPINQIRVAGFDASDNLVLVQGQDLMSCAVTGGIEGAKCTLPDLLSVPPPEVDFNSQIIRLATESSSSLGSFPSEVSATFQEYFFFSVGRYYLIHPRLKGDPNPGPGDWELLLGTPLFQSGVQDNTSICRDIPIVPEATEAAAKALAPSRDWCGSSEVSCAGTKLDERLPLEDELSSDHDDIESSWRHYLELARNAVDHADALGEEYVQAALQSDIRDEDIQIRRAQREEQAVAEFQRVQEICGSAADPNAILQLLGTNTDGDLDLSEIENVPCKPRLLSSPTCGTHNLADEHPELGAISACLGSFGELEEMHLGDGFLCAVPSNVNLDGDGDGNDDVPRIRIVESCFDDSQPDPMNPGRFIADDVAPDTGCDSATLANMTTVDYHCIPDTDGLALFETDSLVPDPPLPALCEGIRQLRAQPARDDEQRNRLLSVIRKEPILQTHNAMTKLEYTIGDGPLDGPFVKLMLGGKPITSAPDCDPADPLCLCGPEDTQCPDPSKADGLFCRKWNCANEQSRADLNLRLYKAGAALGGSTQTVWYLNYYLHAVRANTAVTNQQWTLFSFPQIPASHAPRGHFLRVPSGTVPAVAFGSQQWPAEGPKPTLPGTGGSHDQNEPTHLALRDAKTGGQGLAFDLLAERPASVLDPSGVVDINPHFTWLGERAVNGLATMPGCVSDPNVPQLAGACDLNVEKFIANTGLLQVGPARELKDGLDKIGLQSAAVDSELAPAPRQVVGTTPATVFGQQVFPPPADNKTTTSFQVDVQSRLDAIELACEAQGGASRQLEEGCGVAPEIHNVGHFEDAGNYLECLGNAITKRAASAVYRLPRLALDNLRNGERVFDATGGALAVTTSDLRNSLLEAATSGPIIGGTIRRFGQDLRALRAQLERAQASKAINGLILKSTIADQITSCISASSSIFTLDVPAIAGGIVAGAATCANSIAQIGFATQIAELQDQVLKLESDQAIAEFSGRVSDYVTTLETQSLRLSQALEGIQRNLELMESQQQEARRAMQSAIWQLTHQAAKQRQISRVLDNLQIGKYVRYRRAFENAQKMAFFAKRAIEMRLGMPLSDMVYDLPLVTAPAGWEATVCQSTGIDYAALRDGTGVGSSSVGRTFADAFLGDYVTKLEQVVESYRLVNNFHEGEDRVVASLRDDIHNTRASCDAESPNLLYWASSLQPFYFLPGDDGLGWTQTGCVMESAELEDGTPFERPAGNCIVVLQRNDAPFFNPLIGVPPVPAWDVEFGLPEWCGEFCAYQEGAAISQAIELDPGRYRFSWYTTDADGGGGAVAGHARHADGEEFPDAEDKNGQPVRGFVEGLDGDWNRIFFEFDVFSKETVTISFERPSSSDFVVPLAAPLLEKLEDPLHSRTEVQPPAFTDTSNVRRAFLPVCEDTTGENFRARKWHRNCLKLCPDGYSSNCPDQARTECYWETSFNVNQRSIEAGHMFNQSGFARGNFNYRIRSLGVNFVGTDLRACEGSSLPTTCNAAGFIPYSIIHGGPYYVRNHKGQDYRLALFPGRIEHARGLATERYVTNPLGDADQKLLEPYMRSEFNGRPLDGDFIVRVWDEPGVNFDAIQDVQLIIDYGYWTRFN